MTHLFSFVLCLVNNCNYRKTKLFDSEQILDMDIYVVMLKIRAWVSDNFEILVEHEPRWYLKDLPLPRINDFGLVDAPSEPIIPCPSPPAPPTECSQISPDNDMIYLTSNTEDEDKGLGCRAVFSSFLLFYFRYSKLVFRFSKHGYKRLGEP